MEIDLKGFPRKTKKLVNGCKVHKFGRFWRFLRLFLFLFLLELL